MWGVELEYEIASARVEQMKNLLDPEDSPMSAAQTTYRKAYNLRAQSRYYKDQIEERRQMLIASEPGSHEQADHRKMYDKLRKEFFLRIAKLSAHWMSFMGNPEQLEDRERARLELKRRQV